jgi:hypothetical protein
MNAECEKTCQVDSDQLNNWLAKVHLTGLTKYFNIGYSTFDITN